MVYRKESMARVEALNVKYWGRTVHDDDAAGYLRQSVGVMLEMRKYHFWSNPIIVEVYLVLDYFF